MPAAEVMMERIYMGMTPQGNEAISLYWHLKSKPNRGWTLLTQIIDNEAVPSLFGYGELDQNGAFHPIRAVRISPAGKVQSMRGQKDIAKYDEHMFGNMMQRTQEMFEEGFEPTERSRRVKLEPELGRVNPSRRSYR